MLLAAGVLFCLHVRLEPFIKVIALAFFCLGLLNFSATDIYGTPAISEYQDRWIQAEGTLLSNLDENSHVLYIDRLTYRGIKTGYRGRAVLFVEGICPIAPGQRVKVEGKIGSFFAKDREMYYRGLGALCYIRSYTQYIDVFPAKYSIRYYSFRVARGIKALIEESFPHQGGEMIKGLLLGGRHVDSNVRARFSGAGISHLLAVSGLHVGIITGVLIWIAKKTRLSPTARFILTCSFLLFFCFMVGLTPSVIRASIMVAVVLLAGVVNRQQDPLTSLLFTAFIITCLSPYTVYNISFQLSFLSCLGLVMFYPIFFEKLSFLGRFLSNGIALTLSCQVLIIPLVIYYFGRFTPISVLTNLIVIPLSGLLLWTAIIFLVLAGLKFPLYVLMIHINDIIIKTIDYVIIIASKIPYGNIPIESIDVALLVLYYLLAGVGLALFPFKYKKKGCDG